ncbi:hypothetical protein CR513_17540, partial [Mucuna pruriens]
MASSKVLCRLSCRLQAVARNNLTKPSLSLNLNPLSLSARRLSRTSRLPVELGSWESMMPLHSALASARLVSSLSIDSLGWGLVPQGLFFSLYSLMFLWHDIKKCQMGFVVFPCLYDSICLQFVAARTPSRYGHVQQISLCFEVQLGIYQMCNPLYVVKEHIMLEKFSTGELKLKLR